MELKIRLSRVYADTLLAKKVHQKRAGLVVLLGERGLLVLIPLNVLHVLVEEVRRVHWAALSFGMELCAKDGARGVDQALIRLVV